MKRTLLILSVLLLALVPLALTTAQDVPEVPELIAPVIPEDLPVSAVPLLVPALPQAEPAISPEILQIAPVANDDSILTVIGRTATTLESGDNSVLDNDGIAAGDTVTVSLVNGPQNGVLTLNDDGTFIYTHDGSSSSSDSFTYTATNQDSETSNTATVNITILSETGYAVRLVNALRNRVGNLNCLAEGAALQQVATGWSQEMDAENVLKLPQEAVINPRLTSAGYAGVYSGGTVTRASLGVLDTAEEALAAWRSSRRNYELLVIDFHEEVGFGYVAGDDRDYWTVLFGAGGGDGPIPCPANLPPITHIPTVQNPTDRSMTLPTFNWTRNTATTAGRVPATAFDVEVVDSGGNTVLRAPFAPTYQADNICTQTTCSIAPAASDYENGSGLTTGQTYTVYVRAWSETGGYVWSSGLEFVVDPNATPEPTAEPTDDPTPVGPVPELLAPSGTINVPDGNPRYEWEGIAGATAYEFYVGTPSQSVIFAMFDAARYCAGTACAIPDAAALNPDYRLSQGQHQVYIRAWTNGNPSSEWGGPYDFALSTTPPAPPSNLGLMALTDTVISKPAYTWELSGDALYATDFTLYVAPTNNPTQPVVSQVISRIDACGSPDGTSCMFASPNHWLTNTPHSMYINSIGPGGSSTGGVLGSGFAGVDNLTINAQIPAVPSFTVAPNQGRPTISLPFDPNVSFYQAVVFDNTNTQIAGQWFENPCTGAAGAACTLAPAFDLPAGTYQMYLQAYGPAGFNGGSATTLGGPESFTIPFSTAPGRPSALAVSEGGSGSPTFSWQGVNGATWYNLQVRPFGATIAIFDQWYLASDVGCGNAETCTVSPVMLALPNNLTYAWTVTPIGPGGFGAPASGDNFTVNAALPGAPTLLSPNTITAVAMPDPTLQWAHVTHVAWYQVVINAGAPEANPDAYFAPLSTWVKASDLDCLDDEICTLPTDISLGSGSYSWTVRGYSPGGLGAWANSQPFIVQLP